MFGNSLLRDYEDPFFSAHQEQMRQMDAMFQDPFGMMGFGIAPPQAIAGGAITGVEERRRDQLMRGERQRAMMPHGRGLFDDMFTHMNQMMGMTHQMMGNMQQQMAAAHNNPNSHFYSSSSVMTYDNVGGGQPRVFQASSSTTQAPGGVKETRKTVRDSESGVHKMSVGHHIGDRGHTISRERNVRTGDEEENVDYINLDEDEAQEFDREWRDRTRHYNAGRSLAGNRRQHDRPRAIGDGRSRYEGSCRQHGGQYRTT